MVIYRICKSFSFEAAHRLVDAVTAECKDSIHGHSYKVELYIVTPVLDPFDMVLDFGILKDFVKQIEAEWDHALHLNADEARGLDEVTGEEQKYVLYPGSPTAESMAAALYQRLEGFLLHTAPAAVHRGVTIEKVRVQETDTGWAEYEVVEDRQA